MLAAEVDQMTLQEAMDYVIDKLVNVNKGKRSLRIKGNREKCAYSDDNGLHCGIGWLLDENNETLMNAEVSVRWLTNKPEFSSFVPSLIKNNFRAFLNLQMFHDSNSREDRNNLLKVISQHVNTSNPNWRRWVEQAERE